MDTRCTTNKYGRLYARWLENPGKLLDAAGYQPGMRVLDLCGGTGAISKECLRRGAEQGEVVLFDLHPRCLDHRVDQLRGDANRLGDVFGDTDKGTFDLIVCRQAAAYLDWSGPTLTWLRALLKPGGRLAFNLFVRPRWSFKTYIHGGSRFFEASAYFGRTVYHVQACSEVGIDVTRFHWHDWATLAGQIVAYGFDNCITTNGRSQTWICTPSHSE